MHLGCEDVQRLIPWLLDDELDPEQSLELEGHLDGCGACRAVLENEGKLRMVVRRAGRSVYASSSLRRRVHEAIELDRRQRYGSRVSKAWPAALAAGVLLALMWGGVGGSKASVLEEIASRHTRDLPMDVTAADVAPLQKYFQRQLDVRVDVPVRVPVRNLGGRVVRVGDRDAAHVRVETDKGRVSVFVYHDEDERFASEVEPRYTVGHSRVVMRNVRGFTVARWREKNGMVYAVVSEMPEQELSATLGHWLGRRRQTLGPGPLSTTR